MIKTKWNNKLLILISIVILVLSLTWVFPVKAQSGTTLSISPTNYTAFTCTDSTIAVRVEDVTDLNAFMLWFTFTPGSIEVLEVTSGGFLENLSFYLPIDIDNTAGTIFATATQIARSPKDGSGDLLLIRFRALVPGATINLNIDTTMSELNDGPAGNPIPYTAYNGVITTAECPPAQLSFFPASPIVACSGVDNVLKVRVADVFDLYSYGLNLTYDTGAIEIISVTNGGFLTYGFPGFWNWPLLPYNPEGTIIFEMTQLSAGTNLPKDGAGDLISITYRVTVPDEIVNISINEGSSKLTNWPDVLSIPFNATDAVIYTSSCIPNAVDLKSFDVLRKSKKAILSWETASEIDIQGFNIYRSGKKDGKLKKVNEYLIPADAVGSSSGATYQITNSSLKPWKTYFYWLEWVDMDSNSTLYGPIKAKPPK